MMRPALALLVVIMLLEGCGVVGNKPLPEERYYRLDVSAPQAQAASPAIAGVLVVEVLEAPAVYTRRAIVYSEDPQHLGLQQYHYHHWTDAPPRLVQQALVAYLRQAQMAATITSEAGRAQWDYRISGRVLRFERLRVEAGWQIAADVELRVDAQHATRPLLLRNYTRNLPAGGESMEATVQAFSTAVGEMFAAFTADLGAALPPPAGPG